METITPQSSVMGQNGEAAVATMHDPGEVMMDNTEEEEAPTISDAKEESTNSGRVKRERKSIEAFNPASTKNAKVKEIYPDGKGTKLKDIPNVVANLQAITWSDPHLRMLHQIIFGGTAKKKKELKSDLLEFSGIVYTKGKTEDDIKAKMYKLKMDDLKEVMDLIDVDRSTKSFGLAENKSPDKEDHCIRLLEWIEKPKASGNKKGKLEKAAPKKRKSPEGGKKSKVSPAPSVKKTKKTAETNEKKASSKPPAKSPTTKVTNSVADEIDLNIPGVDIDKLKAKVKSIVEHGNRQELTVKSIRLILEEWLDTDLTEHKDAIRSIVMDAM